MGQYKIDGLLAGTEYIIKIRAKTGDAFGPWSAPIDYETDVLPTPDAPVITSVTPDEESLIVKWPEGVIGTVYEVHYSTSTGFAPDNTTLYNKTVGVSETIHGLVAGTTYYVKLVAISPEGEESAASTQVSGVPLAFAAGSLPVWGKIFQHMGA